MKSLYLIAASTIAFGLACSASAYPTGDEIAQADRNAGRTYPSERADQACQASGACQSYGPSNRSYDGYEIYKAGSFDGTYVGVDPLTGRKCEVQMKTRALSLSRFAQQILSIRIISAGRVSSARFPGVMLGGLEGGYPDQRLVFTLLKAQGDPELATSTSYNTSFSAIGYELLRVDLSERQKASCDLLKPSKSGAK